MDRLFWQVFDWLNLAVGFLLRVAASELRCAGVTYDTALGGAMVRLSLPAKVWQLCREEAGVTTYGGKNLALRRKQAVEAVPKPARGGYWQVD